MILLVFLGIAGLLALIDLFRRKWLPELTHRRGAKLITPEEAAVRVAEVAHGPYVPPPGFPGLLFGGLFLPFQSFAYTGFVWFGAVGSGKTLTFVQLVRSVLDLIARPGSRARLCLYDPKREFSKLVLASLPAHVPVYRLNFLDRRSVWWDLAKDFRTPAELHQLAAFIVRIVNRNELQPYFTQSGQAIVYAVLLAVEIAAPGEWTLVDVIAVLGSRKRTKYFLSLTPEGRAAKALYLKARSGRDVLATIASHVDKLKIIAACNRHSAIPFSIRRFMDEQAVVLLELVDSASELQKGFYQLFVRKVSDEILVRVRSDCPTVLALDELVSLGEVDLLPLTTKGRASGAVVAATVMSLPALEESLGSPGKAKALLDNLQTQAVLKLDGPTAEHCSKLIGDEEVDEVTISVANRQGDSGQRTVTEQQRITSRRLVTPDEIKTLPSPDYAGGTVAGYFRLKDVGTFRADVRFREGFPPLRSGPAIPDFDPRSAAQMRLPDGFTRADLARLAIPDSEENRGLFGVV